LEFNVPFQHMYGYIRDEYISSRVFLQNIITCLLYIVSQGGNH